MSIVAADLTGVVATADTRGVVGVCTASATTRVASTLLAGAVVRAACVFAAAALRVVFAAVVPDFAGAVVGCAGAVASVESGSDPPAAVVAAVPADREEPAGESVSAPPVLTTAPRLGRTRRRLRRPRRAWATPISMSPDRSAILSTSVSIPTPSTGWNPTCPTPPQFSRSPRPSTTNQTTARSMRSARTSRRWTARQTPATALRPARPRCPARLLTRRPGRCTWSTPSSFPFPGHAPA